MSFAREASPQSLQSPRSTSSRAVGDKQEIVCASHSIRGVHEVTDEWAEVETARAENRMVARESITWRLISPKRLLPAASEVGGVLWRRIFQADTTRPS